MTGTLTIVLRVLIGIPAVLFIAWKVHGILGRACVGNARRFCSRNGREIRRVRWQPEFEQQPDGSRGVKTEFTLVQLDGHSDRRGDETPILPRHILEISEPRFARLVGQTP